MKNISKHVSWHEGKYSRTEARRELDKTQNEDQLKWRHEVDETLYAPLREKDSGGIKIEI